MSRKESEALLEGMTDGEKAAYFQQMLGDTQKELKAANKELQAKKTSKKGGPARSTRCNPPPLQGPGIPPLQAPTADEEVSAVDNDGTPEIILVDLGDAQGGSSDFNAVGQAIKKKVWRVKKWSSKNQERAFAEMVLDHLNKKGFQLTNNPSVDACTYSHTVSERLLSIGNPHLQISLLCPSVFA